MPRHRSRLKVVGIGEVTWQTEEGQFWVIGEDRSPEGEACLLVSRPDGDHVLMRPIEVVDAANEAKQIGARLSGPVEKSENEWVGVPDRERIRVQRRAQDLTMAVTGSPHGDLVARSADGNPVHPRYDPAKIPQITARLKLLEEDLVARGESGARLRNLWDQLTRLENAHGRARVLVHGSYNKRRDPADRASVELRDAIRRFALDRVGRETMTLANLEIAFKRTHGNLLGDVEDRVWRAALKREAYRQNLLKLATTRRDQSIRTPERPGMWIANRPYESLQLDSTPLDLFALDDRGQILTNLHLVVAVDPYCSKIRALRIVAGDEPFTTQTVRQLLFDTVAKRLLRKPYEPGCVGASPHLATHVGLGSIVVDRGPQFVGLQTLGQNAGFSTHVVIAPPGRGDRKPHVESRFRGLAILQELLPGAKGANTRVRGRNPERYPMLRVEALAEILVAIVEGVVHHTPMNKLHPETQGAISITPSQIEEQYYRTNGVIEVDDDYYRALELLKVERRVIGDQGINVLDRQYWDPALEDIRQTTRGAGGLDRKIAVYVDHNHPEAIVVRDPTGHPLVVPQIGGDTRPVLGDLLARDTYEQVLGGALGDRSPEELKELILDVAHQSASKPVETSTRRHRRNERQAKRELDLTAAYNEYFAGEE